MAKKQKLYSFTDHPEHKAELKPWADKWIANAMSTKPMDDEERAICREAVKGLYRAANLTPPPDNRIIFVPSPFVLRFAGGFSAAIHWLRKNKDFKLSGATHGATQRATRDATQRATHGATQRATRDATYDATQRATRDATQRATYDATHGATRGATHGATQRATRDATYDATYDATHGATHGATHDATQRATYDATYDATHGATRGATHGATRGATHDATRDATYDATHGATHGATHDATRDATQRATYDATRDATQRATYDATHDATHGATHGDDYYECEKRGLIKLAFELKIGKFGLQCATAAYSMWQGGNQWSAWDSFLTFFRHIAKLPIDYSKYDHWEQLALHSGPRIMHPEFCMISDRPVVLKVDDRNRPHCEDGPFCKWSDGSAIYAWDGVFIPKWWIEEKHRLTPEIALHWENIEQRRIACTILGWDKITKDLDGVTIHTDDDPHIGQLIEVDMPDIGKEKFLKVLCGTGREFMLPVPKEMRTAREANAWTYGLAEKDFAPEVRT